MSETFPPFENKTGYDPRMAAVIGVDPRSVRVPDGFNGPEIEMSITGVAMVGLIMFLIAVLSVATAKLRTERRAQPALQTVIDASNQVVANANEQTKIAQQVLRDAEIRFKAVIDGANAAFEKAFAGQRSGYEGVIQAQASRIVSLTDHLIKAGVVADERVADAIEASETRFERERSEWRTSLAAAGERARHAADALGVPR